MAKKAQANQSQNQNPIEDGSLASKRLDDKIRELYGDGLICGGNDIVERPRTIIPISPSMDIITGGILEGSWVGITGPPKHTKTSLSLAIAANAQKQEYGSRDVYYCKIEGRLSPSVLRGTKGLILERPRLNVIEPTMGKILSDVEWLTIIGEIIKTKPRAVIIIDSLSSLCGEKEMAEGPGTETRSSGNKAVSQFCRLYGNFVPINNTIVIGITHMIANVSGYGAPMSEKGANAWKYQRDYHLRSKGKSDWVSGNKVIGWKVQWECENSPLVPPGMQAECSIRFGTGPDATSEIIDLAVSCGVIQKSGAWLSYSYPEAGEQKEIKTQGSEKFAKALEDNPDIYQRIYSQTFAFFKPQGESDESASAERQ